MQISLVLLLIFVGTVNLLDLNPLENKYFEVIMDRFEVVYENKSIIQIEIKVLRAKKDRVLKGRLTYVAPFGNNVMIEVKTLKKQGGEYRYLPYRVPPTPFCDGLANDNYVYPDLVSGSDFPADISSNCPLQGNYTVRNVTFNMRNIPSITRIAQSGDYAGEIIHHINNQHVATYRIFGTINNV